MDTFLVVRTLDVNYGLLDIKSVVASLDGGPPQALTLTKQKGVTELRLPPSTACIEVSVDAKGFWPVTQKLTLNAGKLPTLSWDGAQSINARDLEAHTRGDDANVVINVVLGQVKDARTEVDAIFSKGGVYTISPMPQHIRDLEASILNPGGRGWDRLRHSVKADQVPDGKMFFVQRLTSPKLVAIYQPHHRFMTFQRGGSSPIQTPVPYHLFFHPSTAHFKFQREYPFHSSYLDLVSRYMLQEQTFGFGKAMVNQHQASGKRPVFVFPIGSPTESFGSLPRQSDLLRLLQEINFWLQRMAGIAYPVHPVGRCAVSGYSAGCAAIRAMLSMPFAPFDERHLREIYAFDLYTPDDITGMCASLGRWFRRGADDRKIRIYTQNATWLQNMQALLPRGTVTNGPSNAFEEETPSSTLLFDPARKFWGDMGEEVTAIRPEFGRLDNVPGKVFSSETDAVKHGKMTQADLNTAKYYEVHDVHPALFMTHALKLSSFAD